MLAEDGDWHFDKSGDDARAEALTVERGDSSGEHPEPPGKASIRNFVVDRVVDLASREQVARKFERR